MPYFRSINRYESWIIHTFKVSPASRWNSFWLQSNQLKLYDFMNGGRVIKISIYDYLPSLITAVERHSLSLFCHLLFAQLNGPFIYWRVWSLESKRNKVLNEYAICDMHKHRLIQFANYFLTIVEMLKQKPRIH